MDLKTFLFGRPSRQREIELEWKQSLAEAREKYGRKISSVEKHIMNEIGFPSENAPKSIDEKLHRLESLDMQIGSMIDDLGAIEDQLFFDMMDKIKKEQIESASLPRKIWLWMYWHV